MKQTTLRFALGTALLFSGCSADDLRTDYGTGYLNFALTTAPLVADLGVRAVPEGYVELPSEVLPSADDFHFTLTGTYTDINGKACRFDQTWDRFANYSSDYPLEALESNYSATFSYGSETAEGAEAPYFQQTVSNISLKPDATTRVEVSIPLANACFRLLLDPSMTDYYTDIELTITTPAGGRFPFTAATATARNILFVRTGQSLTLSGSARHAASGQTVTFPSQVINADHPTRPATLHTITLRADGVGGARIGIAFDGSFEEIKTDDVYVG